MGNIVQGMLIGVIATLVIDIWALFVARVLRLPTANWALVGRWFGYLVRGTFAHQSIGNSAPIGNELAIGWIAHYLTGIVYGVAYLVIVQGILSGNPSLQSALIFGLATLVAPWLILQPGMGAGVFATRTPRPNVTRLVNVSMHVIFGISLYGAWLLVESQSVSSVAWSNEAAPEPGQRVVLITGSTGGLGRETALALAGMGHHVIIHGRSIERANEIVRQIEDDGRGSARFYKADFSNLAEVRKLAAAIRADYDRLDVLVNNAGVFLPDRSERRVTEDGYEIHFQVNYLAGYVLTNLLLPLLEASAPSRVVNVASGQLPLDFDDLMFERNYEGLEAYLRSKNAQIMMTFAMESDLSRRGISTNALFPSALMNTDMVIEAGFEPESSVETGRDALLQLINDEVGSGHFFNVFEVGEAIPQASDRTAQKELIKMSESLTSVRYLDGGH